MASHTDVYVIIELILTHEMFTMPSKLLAPNPFTWKKEGKRPPCEIFETLSDNQKHQSPLIPSPSR